MNEKSRPDDWYRHDARAFLEGVQGMGPELIGAYIVIIDILYARNGIMPRDDRHLSGVLGCSVRKARALTDGLIDLKKIGEIDGQIVNERAEKELERRRNERETSAKGGRTKAENATRNNEIKDLTSTKRREEKRVVKREANASPKKATRLSESWSLPRDWGEWAVSEGWPEAVIRSEAAKFRDFWISKAGRDATKIDWSATWRNWMRNCKTPKFSAITGGQYGGSTSKTAERLNAFVSGARGSS